MIAVRDVSGAGLGAACSNFSPPYYLNQFNSPSLCRVPTLYPPETPPAQPRVMRKTVEHAPAEISYHHVALNEITRHYYEKLEVIA